MKLNHDCIRAVLLHIESAQNLIINGALIEWKVIPLKSFCSELPSFSKEEIYYSLHMLDEAGLIEARALHADGGIYAYHGQRMTFAGHEYLEKIRNDNTWNTVKSVASKVGSASLSVIASIAEGVTSALISKVMSDCQ